MAENASKKPSLLEKITNACSRVAEGATEKAIELKVKYDSMSEGGKAAVGLAAIAAGMAFDLGPVDDALKITGACGVAGVAKRYLVPNVDKKLGYQIVIAGVAAAALGMLFDYSLVDDILKIGGAGAARFFYPHNSTKKSE